LVAEKTAENLIWGLDWNEDANKLVATDIKGKIIQIIFSKYHIIGIQTTKSKFEKRINDYISEYTIKNSTRDNLFLFFSEIWIETICFRK